MRRVLLWMVGCLGVAAVAALVFYGARRVHSQSQEPSEAANKGTSQSGEKLATGPNGEPVVHLNPAGRAASGVRTTTLERVSGRTETQVVAVVLSPQDLLDLRTAYIAAAVQVEKAKATLNASNLEYQRLSQLNQEDKNASDKAVQAAEATFRSDQATLHNTEQALELARMPAVQRWGPVVSKWITGDTPLLHEVLEARRVLLQVTLPSNTPASLQLLIQAGQHTTETLLLSPIPRVDPRFQTPSYLYTAVAEKELVPGMNLVAFAPGGSQLKGVLLPREAVLWWQGKSWVYIETEPGSFMRKEVSLDTPLSNGWFVRQGLMPGNHVVTTGAQQLLSQEFRSQTQVVGGGDTD
jgi:membrane fusion protein, multidrug efflux system